MGEIVGKVKFPIYQSDQSRVFDKLKSNRSLTIFDYEVIKSDLINTLKKDQFEFTPDVIKFLDSKYPGLTNIENWKEQLDKCS